MSATAEAAAPSRGEGATRPHVLVMLDSLVPLGGAETLAVELATRLDAARYRRTFCLTRWDGSSPPSGLRIEQLRASGAGLLPLRRRSAAQVRPWLELVSYLRREKVDLIHSHKFGSNAWAVLCARVARRPIVVAHEHMRSYRDAPRLRRLIDRDWIAPRAGAFVAVSEAGRRQMIEVEGVAADRVICIPNGIPPPGDGDGEPIRGALGIGAGEVVVGTLAHLRPEKALDLLVEAAASLRGEAAAVHVVIAGDGPERSRLEGRIAASGVGDRVHLLGHRTDVADLLAAFDLAVCCSDFEGGPLSVIEYMSAGLPTVATNVGGLPELVGDSTTGLLVPPRDPAALADAIRSLAFDPDLRRRLGERARERYLTEYSIDSWVARVEALYERVLPAPLRTR